MSVFSICIEGTKGSGKSSTIDKLAQKLVAAGCAVDFCAPFAAANEYAQSNGFASARAMISASKEDNQKEIAFIRAAMATAKENAERRAQYEAKPVVLIYDRGWMTIRPHLFGGRWGAEDSTVDTAIPELWSQVQAEAPATVFLHASFELTRQRRPGVDTLGGLDTDDKLREDVESRTAFAQAHSDRIALSFDTGVTPQETVVDDIAAYIRSQIKKPAGIVATLTF